MLLPSPDFFQCRVPSEKGKDAFLINPFGLSFHEVTGSNLLKVDLHGKIIDRGSSKFGINNRGFILHSAIHEARKDVNCIVHCHVPEVIAVCQLSPSRVQTIGFLIVQCAGTLGFRHAV